MNDHSLFTRARRGLAFARHMPLAKLARRTQLTITRALGDRFPSAFDSGVRKDAPPARSPNPPLPVFAPRRGLLTANDHALSFTFLGRTHAMPLEAMDWQAPGAGPAHQLWRMNLHYMEYLEAVPDDLLCALISRWIEGHPAGRPGAWRDSWNSYALSLRTVVWMQQLALRPQALPAPFLRAVETSLAGQLRFLLANLETDLGGNHLIKNIKALVWGACYFKGPEPDRWRTHALALLDRELSHQILPDGMHDERSPSYHCQVFADLIEIRHALASGPLDGRLDGCLSRMAQVTADLTHPDGFVAQFNDAGLTMAYAPRACLEAHARLTLSPPPMARPVFAYGDAGYYGLHARHAFLVIDCGRIAPDDLPAHGHGDILSFELSVAGERMIVDQGVFEYVAGEKRARARGASSHNTLCFEGADQAEFFGAFRCGRRPQVTVRHYAPTASGFDLEGTHDGFLHLPGAPRHIRRFEASPEALTITDTIEGSSDRPAAIAFLLHPGTRVALSPQGARITSATATLDLTSSLLIAIEDAVWWPDMGQERPTRRLRLVFENGTRTATTRLSWQALDPG